MNSSHEFIHELSAMNLVYGEYCEWIPLHELIFFEMIADFKDLQSICILLWMFVCRKPFESSKVMISLPLLSAHS